MKYFLTAIVLLLIETKYGSGRTLSSFKVQNSSGIIFEVKNNKDTNVYIYPLQQHQHVIREVEYYKITERLRENDDPREIYEEENDIGDIGDGRVDAIHVVDDDEQWQDNEEEPSGEVEDGNDEESREYEPEKDDEKSEAEENDKLEEEPEHGSSEDDGEDDSGETEIEADLESDENESEEEFEVETDEEENQPDDGSSEDVSGDEEIEAEVDSDENELEEDVEDETGEGESQPDDGSSEDVSGDEEIEADVESAENESEEEFEVETDEEEYQPDDQSEDVSGDEEIEAEVDSDENEREEDVEDETGEGESQPDDGSSQDVSGDEEIEAEVDSDENELEEDVEDETGEGESQPDDGNSEDVSGDEDIEAEVDSDENEREDDVEDETGEGESQPDDGNSEDVSGDEEIEAEVDSDENEREDDVEDETGEKETVDEKDGEEFEEDENDLSDEIKPLSSRHKRDIDYSKIPEAPTLDKLDFNSLPEYLKTLYQTSFDADKSTPKHPKGSKDQNEKVTDSELRKHIDSKLGDIFSKISSRDGGKQSDTKGTYGMKLSNNNGYVWNDLTKPRVSYNVGDGGVDGTDADTYDDNSNQTEGYIHKDTEDENKPDTENEHTFEYDKVPINETPSAISDDTAAKPNEVENDTITQKLQEIQQLLEDIKTGVTLVNEKPVKEETPILDNESLASNDVTDVPDEGDHEAILQQLQDIKEILEDLKNKDTQDNEGEFTDDNESEPEDVTAKPNEINTDAIVQELQDIKQILEDIKAIEEKSVEERPIDGNDNQHSETEDITSDEDTAKPNELDTETIAQKLQDILQLLEDLKASESKGQQCNEKEKIEESTDEDAEVNDIVDKDKKEESYSKEEDSNTDKDNDVMKSPVLMDAIKELMNNEQFWIWLGDWTSSYIEMLMERIGQFVQDEVALQIPAYFEANKDHITAAKYKDENDQEKNDKNDVPFENEERSENGSEESNNDETDEGGNKSLTRKHKETKDEPKPITNTIDASTVYSNAVGNNNITNIFIFHTNKKTDEIVDSLNIVANTSNPNVVNIFVDKESEKESEKPIQEGNEENKNENVIDNKDPVDVSEDNDKGETLEASTETSENNSEDLVPTEMVTDEENLEEAGVPEIPENTIEDGSKDIDELDVIFDKDTELTKPNEDNNETEKSESKEDILLQENNNIDTTDANNNEIINSEPKALPKRVIRKKVIKRKI